MVFFQESPTDGYIIDTFKILHPFVSYNLEVKLNLYSTFQLEYTVNRKFYHRVLFEVKEVLNQVVWKHIRKCGLLEIGVEFYFPKQLKRFEKCNIGHEYNYLTSVEDSVFFLFRREIFSNKFSSPGDQENVDEVF